MRPHAEFRASTAVHIVTDDQRIADAAAAFGAPVIMTSEAARNGTERCAEALAALGRARSRHQFPGRCLAHPAGFRHRADRPHARPARCRRRDPSDAPDQRRSPRAPGRGSRGPRRRDQRRHRRRRSRALFLQAPHSAPSRRRARRNALTHSPSCRGLRLPASALAAYAAAPPSELELLEGLEQLRFLDQGIPVEVVEVETPPFILRELNNPSDVAPIEAALAAAGIA